MWSRVVGEWSWRKPTELALSQTAEQACRRNKEIQSAVCVILLMVGQQMVKLQRSEAGKIKDGDP